MVLVEDGSSKVLRGSVDDNNEDADDDEKHFGTYFKTALSPCLTVMLSFSTESPLLAGTPAGTSNNNLSPRTTMLFHGTVK